jgi:hypothetical protein
MSPQLNARIRKMSTFIRATIEVSSRTRDPMMPSNGGVPCQHGRHVDQIVPIADSALLSAKLVKKGTLKVYPGLPHGICTTDPDVINPDLLAFVKV